MSAPQPVTVPAEAGPYRVVVVDDSAVVRGLVSRWVESDPELFVAGSYGDGRPAVDHVRAVDAEVVVLDVEMPGMDGLTALPLILRAHPGVKVLISSSLTRRNAEISVRALSLGAADYVAKPESTRGVTTSDDFRRELVSKIKALGYASRKERRRAQPSGQRAAGPAPAHVSAAISSPVMLRAPSSVRPKVLAIGSSTGGPQALFALTKALAPFLDIPVVLTQHMPATFTTILAEHITKASGIPAAEARDGEVLRPRTILVAPGEYHMIVEAGPSGPVARLNQNPPENFCRPAVDPLFRSVATQFGAAALAVVLTGMGSDGREGGRAIAAAGGTLLAQDEATSVVWGMPGAVTHAGLASAVLPLDRIAGEIAKLMGKRP